MIVLRSITLALAYISGIVAATRFRAEVPVPLLVVFMLLGVVATAWLYLDERRWIAHPHYITALAVVLIGAPLGYGRTMQQVGSPPEGSFRAVLQSLADRTPVMVRGQIVAEPDVRNDRNVDLHVKVAQVRVNHGDWQRIRSDKVLLRVSRSGRANTGQVKALRRIMDTDAYGYSVEFKSRYAATRESRNPNEFDMAGFLSQHGLVTRLQCGIGDVTVVEETRGHPLMEIALAAKRRFLIVYKQTIRSPASLLTAAATLGTRRAVEKQEFRGKDISGMFRHAGVGHVLAVSGLHVTVISLLLYFLFGLSGLRPRVFVPPLIFFLLLFALLTGARPSSMRAVIMNSVILVAFAYFRFDLRHATYVGLALASFIILIVSPLILYSPSFLLSFGAVLSLVLITPTLDRWLCRLRGFALLFALAWFAAVMAITSANLPFLLAPRNTIGMAALLWCLVLVGGRLNERVPAAWRFGIERMPATLRLLVSAQLAIQFGMMIPMSAWFFGQFPVAGVLVNILAIPAIGVLVQLGLLTGLMGLVPFLGRFLAAPFGASATLVGNFFYWLAFLGSEIFPFPSTPKPSPVWMAAYYLALAAALSMESWRVPLQDCLYRGWQRLTPPKRRALGALFAIPLLLALLPLTGLQPTPTTCKRITCLAEGRLPIMVLAGTGGKVALINAGDRYAGERIVFNVVRSQGAAMVDTAILASPQPEAGNEGLAALAGKMGIRNCFVPVITTGDETYLEALQDDYLQEKARQGEYWAANYDRAYVELRDIMAEKGTELTPMAPGELLAWDNMRLDRLPVLDRKPTRFVSSAKTAVLGVDFGGYRWLVVTETTIDGIHRAVPKSAPDYDVLVLPDQSTRKSYRSIIDAAVKVAAPRIVIVAGEQMPRSFDFDRWAREKGPFELFMTARDGAVTADLTSDDNLRLSGFSSGRTVVIGPRPADSNVEELARSSDQDL